jgi:uncharacterized protein YciI
MEEETAAFIVRSLPAPAVCALAFSPDASAGGLTSRDAGSRRLSRHSRTRPRGKKANVTTFLVVLRRSGPQWDPSRPLEEQSDWPAHASFMDRLVDAGVVVLGGPLGDEHRVVLVVEAESDAAVRATLARDPWSETHLRVDTIDPWTIRLDGRPA